MATITTKYDIGDVVWFARLKTETKAHPCPDCLGALAWSATSPAGGVFSVDCPRCAASYQSSSALNLKYTVWAPDTQRLTIGSVQADTSDAGNKYMCLETGVGSGQVYGEDSLFSSEDEAWAEATAKAAENNANADGWVAQQYAKTVEFSDYQMKDAEMEAAKRRADRIINDARYLIEDIETSASMDEVAERIAAWRAKAEAAR